MKGKVFIVFLAMITALILFAGSAMAEPRYAGVEPTGDANGNVSIPALPNGSVVQVWLWNDCTGTKGVQLGSVHSFQLPDSCSSFSFEWIDRQENKYWQLVTEKTKPGGALRAIYHAEGFKYGLPAADVNRHK
jgi:hypothetical protein